MPKGTQTAHAPTVTTTVAATHAQPPDALVDPLADPLQTAITPPISTAPTTLNPLTAAPTLASPTLATPTLAPTSPGTSSAAPKTAASLPKAKSNKAAPTWKDRNDLKPWQVGYDAFADEGHTSHHLIPDNSLLALGGHITKMGLWGNKATQDFTDEFVMRDVLANTDASKHDALRAKLAGYKAKTKRTTGDLGGATEVEDTGLQGVLHDGMHNALDDEDLSDFAKKFQGAFEWRPANTVLGPTSSLRWDDPKEGFDVPATLLAYGDQGDTEAIAQNSKNIKAFTGNTDVSTAPDQLTAIMKGLTTQNRKGESLTGKDASGKPLPFLTERDEWEPKTKSNKADVDAYEAETLRKMEQARGSSGGDAAATSIQTARDKKRPALSEKKGFVTKTDPTVVADIRSRLKV